MNIQIVSYLEQRGSVPLELSIGFDRMREEAHFHLFGITCVELVRLYQAKNNESLPDKQANIAIVV
jgi:hypothetical protein